MNPELPTVIAAFFQAHNSGQTHDFNTLFTDDAMVSDEAHEYRGATIKEWIDGAVAKYQPKADVTHLATVGEQTIATAQVNSDITQPNHSVKNILSCWKNSASLTTNATFSKWMTSDGLNKSKPHSARIDDETYWFQIRSP